MTIRVWLLLIVSSGLAADEIDFERHVAPILSQRCLECHVGAEPAGGLALDRPDGPTTGGDSGPAFVAGDPTASRLIERIASGDMPPKREGKPRPLPQSEIETLRQWIATGAKWPQGRRIDPFERTLETRAGRDWWSLQPIVRPDVPKRVDGTRADNPIDAFVETELAKHGWTLAPATDRRALVRRVYVDLWGLPPTVEEVERFLADPDPQAYENLVDSLLASPRYAERAARQWLDVARWAETSGYERDQVKPKAWRYRDWLIRAFDQDLPYNQFVIHQLAGDEVSPPNEEAVVATGFLRLGTWNDEPNDPSEYVYDRLEDMVHATTTAFLGLTVKCARCHDHKFDPIRQEDYYRVAGAFWAGYIQPGPREDLGGPSAEQLGYDVFGWTDVGTEAPPLRALKKGDIHRPEQVVEPASPSFLPTLERKFDPPSELDHTTTRRSQLAQWIVDGNNPLTPRVWVNRIWQNRFGEGLVRSPDNFGFTGDKPTHPELLDWLAAELKSRAWRTKPLVRLVVTSQTYRQSSLHPRQDEINRTDAGNRLLWRANRRRLDAETLRDSLLLASGRLDLSKVGGPSFAPDIQPDALEGLSTKSAAWTASPPEEQRRRSLYIFSKRGLLPPLMTVFDAPDTTLPCGRRDVTTVAPQALALLNNDFAHQQATALAERVASEQKTPTEQATMAWRATLARNPTPEELALAVDHIAVQNARVGGDRPSAGLASLCQVLMMSNEFAYVD